MIQFVMALQLPGNASFLVSVLTVALIYAILALGLNVHFGYTGLLNFGHVAFFAAGAYTAAILTIPPPGAVGGTTVQYEIGFGLPMPYALPVSLGMAAVAGGLLAFLIGLTSVRLGTHYLAIATFALAGIFHDFLVNERWLTRGVFGLNVVPKPGRSFLGADAWAVAYLIFTALLVVSVYLLLERVVNAPFGRLLKGVREDERAAQMLGKDVNWVKLKSFTVGGAVAGLAGAVYAHYFGTVVALTFVPNVTFLVWIAMLLGGAASNRGMVVGSLIIIGFRESTRFLGDVPYLGGIANHPTFIPSLRFVVIGLLLILVIRYRPQGVLGNPNEIVITTEESDDS